MRITGFTIFLVFFLSSFYAISEPTHCLTGESPRCNITIESDSDFDHDGVKDYYEITIDKEMKINIHLSSISQERSYSWHHLDHPDDGFSNLYKYGDRNYIVYYYSDFRDGSEYIEDIYVWNPDQKDFVLYLTAEIKSVNNNIDIHTKMAKCCIVAGEQVSLPVYLDASESASLAKNLIDSVYARLKYNQGNKYYLLDEEVAFIMSNYSLVNDDKYVYIVSYYKSKGNGLSRGDMMGAE